MMKDFKQRLHILESIQDRQAGRQHNSSAYPQTMHFHISVVVARLALLGPSRRIIIGSRQLSAVHSLLPLAKVAAER